MELIILTNISIILSLYLILIFINKLAEEKELSLKTIIVTIVTILFIVNCVFEHKSSFLFHLNIFIIVAYIILIITGLFVAISKRKTSYLKFILFGILFLIVPIYTIMTMAVGAMSV
nr:hypothetical protein [uncultured Fusobacterium sp.]